MVVLAGYRAVKEALVNHAEEFGNREITPIFHDFNKGHGRIRLLVIFMSVAIAVCLQASHSILFPGILFSNGDSWREMRRFALATLKDFGMGKKMSEEIITEECQHLIKEFEQFEGKIRSKSKVKSKGSQQKPFAP